MVVKNYTLKCSLPDIYSAEVRIPAMSKQEAKAKLCKFYPMVTDIEFID